MPELILAAHRALESGDAARARELQMSWYAFRALARRFGQPQTTKAAMNVRGWKGGSVRAPLLDLDPAARMDVAALVEKLLGSSGLAAAV